MSSLAWLLKYFVCATFGGLAFKSYKSDRHFVAWLYVSIAILFNPLLPVGLERRTWQIIDAICALIAIGTIYFGNASSLRPKWREAALNVLVFWGFLLGIGFYVTLAVGWQAIISGQFKQVDDLWCLTLGSSAFFISLLIEINKNSPVKIESEI